MTRPLLAGQLDDRAAQPDQFGPRLGRRLADLGADLDHRLVQLGLDLLAEDAACPSSRICVMYDCNSPRLRVDDLILFFDADGQRRRLSSGLHSLGCVAAHVARSTTNVGTVEPPPAVTLSSASVEMRVRQPSM